MVRTRNIPGAKNAVSLDVGESAVVDLVVDTREGELSYVEPTATTAFTSHFVLSGMNLLYVRSRMAFGYSGIAMGLLPTYAEEPGYAELGAVALGLLLVFPFVAFPPNPGEGGAVLNLYTHLLGFCLAFIVGYVAKVEFRLPPLRGVYTDSR